MIRSEIPFLHARIDVFCYTARPQSRRAVSVLDHDMRSHAGSMRACVVSGRILACFPSAQTLTVTFLK